MSKGGGKQTVQNTYPPEILAAIKGNVNVANDIASQPYPGYYDYSKPFNADNYLKQNADVAQGYQKYLSDFNAGAGTFDPGAYLKNNADVAAEAAKYAGSPQFSTPEAYAQWHYDNYGKNEGRTSGTSGTPMSAADYALKDWQTTGQAQGRQGGYDTRQLVADFTPDQTAGFDLTRQIAGNGANFLQNGFGWDEASNLANNFSARDVGTTFSARDVAAGQLKDTNLNDYMNPYIGNVVNTTSQAINRQNQIALQNVGSQAMSQGAYGGSRQGVAQAETNRAYGDTLAQTTANLYNTGYTTAQQAALSDITNRLTADRANQSKDLSLGQLRLSAEQANQAKDLSEGQLKLSAAGQMAQSATARNNALLGQQNYDLNRAGALLGTGGQQQANAQQQLDSQYEQYLRSIGYPVEMLKVRQIPLGGSLPSTQTSSGGGSGGAQTMQTVGSLALAAASLFSDRRVKTDIRRVGALDNGLAVYAYRYAWGGPVHIGVMADEVEAVRPAAVSETPEGIKMVNYDLATEAA
ncbi:tail fiber domain-containing protein [Azospirillum picis]|uniref:Peptidase S74 domain-containing protein n=1 Tax=Azospirillum picis TaxID=488438 RepID=A0ABU0MPL1_9PROT|nr:tail fiber domain-containing protein [Azospirillum picis]MBP2301578.1 hypothetical protein [Azospirillum picis]MDQ0535410.1 hypothetical protein [Azospirillum picis]